MVQSALSDLDQEKEPLISLALFRRSALICGPKAALISGSFSYARRTEPLHGRRK
jgi:hypothetical protein